MTVFGKEASDPQNGEIFVFASVKLVFYCFSSPILVFRPHPVVLSVYFQFCTQGSLQMTQGAMCFVKDQIQVSHMQASTRSSVLSPLIFEFLPPGFSANVLNLVFCILRFSGLL